MTTVASVNIKSEQHRDAGEDYALAPCYDMTGFETMLVEEGFGKELLSLALLRIVDSMRTNIAVMGDILDTIPLDDETRQEVYSIMTRVSSPLENLENFCNDVLDNFEKEGSE